MRRLFTILVVLVALQGVAFAETLKEVFDRTYDIRAGGHLSLDNTNGRVTVKAWDQQRVRIRAMKEVSSRDTGEARRAMGEFRIQVQPDGAGIRVDTIYPKRRGDSVFDWIAGSNVNATAEYEVSVPRALNLDIRTVNGGVFVADVSGELDLETTNGKIDVSRCAGSVDAETTNGGIRVELLQVAKGRSMRLETTNGRITLLLPSNFGASVDASTTNGSISSELPMTVARKTRNSLRGTINGGGADLKLRTTNGGIEIESAPARSASR